APPILINAKSVTGDVPTQDLPGPSAFQTDDPIMLDRAPDRHRWRQFFEFFGGFSGSGKRLMHGRDQGSDLIGSDLITAHIGRDYLGREFSTEGGGLRLVGHQCSPLIS